eukprot:1587590-Pyramimonas_sp.AAC.1
MVQDGSQEGPGELKAASKSVQDKLLDQMLRRIPGQGRPRLANGFWMGLRGFAKRRESHQPFG